MGVLAGSLVLIVALSTVYVRAVRQQLITSVIGSVETAASEQLAPRMQRWSRRNRSGDPNRGDPGPNRRFDSISTAQRRRTREPTGPHQRLVSVVDLGQTPVRGRRLVAGEYVIEPPDGRQPVRLLVPSRRERLHVERTLCRHASSEEMVG